MNFKSLLCWAICGLFLLLLVGVLHTCLKNQHQMQVYLIRKARSKRNGQISFAKQTPLDVFSCWRLVATWMNRSHWFSPGKVSASEVTGRGVTWGHHPRKGEQDNDHVNWTSLPFLPIQSLHPLLRSITIAQRRWAGCRLLSPATGSASAVSSQDKMEKQHWNPGFLSPRPVLPPLHMLPQTLGFQSEFHKGKDHFPYQCVCRPLHTNSRNIYWISWTLAWPMKKADSYQFNQVGTEKCQKSLLCLWLLVLLHGFMAHFTLVTLTLLFHKHAGYTNSSSSRLYSDIASP